MLHRITVLVLSLLFCVTTARAASVLDYQKIGPRETVSRLVTSLLSDSNDERRNAYKEMKERLDHALSLYRTSETEKEFLVLAGDGLIPLFWAGQASVRMRAERLVDEAMGGLLDMASHGKGDDGEVARTLLTRYASVMAIEPNNPSSQKLTEAIVEVMEKVTRKPWQPTPAADLVAAKEAPSAEEPPATKEASKPAPTPAPAAAAPEAAEQSSGPPKVMVRARPVTPKVISAPAAAEAPAQVQVRRVRVSKPTEPAGTRVVVNPSTARTVRVNTPSLKDDQPRELAATSALALLVDQLQAKEDKKVASGLQLAHSMALKVRQSVLYGDGENRRLADLAVVHVRLLLANQDRTIRRLAAQVAGEVKDGKAIAQLIRLLDDPDTAVRDGAKEALVEITGESFGGDADKWRAWHQRQPS